MKVETMIYDRLKEVIPNQAVKTVLFAAVSETSYEVVFHSYFPEKGEYNQCFQMAEDGRLDENQLDTVFAELAGIIRKDQGYKNDKVNLYTVVIDGNGVIKYLDYYEKGVRMFQVKKEWAAHYLN